MDKYILVEHLNLNSVHSVILQTFQSTKRIKITSFDISHKYIIFGASSGGIYIFKREPCEFIKLIPSKEGSALKIAFDSHEKKYSNSKFQRSEDFLEACFKVLIHSQHENDTVTAIKWHGNNIYCGDDKGKVSVFSLGSLLTIFHTPSALLLQLDSGIVQIDTYLNFLLVSTKTRTYLCDTEKEQYKQIGKKLRDGDFGACFFNVEDNTQLSDTPHNISGIFRTLNEEEHFLTGLDKTNINIFCARPGARIWEVNFEATVLITYQFRESLAQHPSDIIHISDDPDARLNISYFENCEQVSASFNFSKIFSVSNRFIFTYNFGGIYFFDPRVSGLVLWSNNFQNIVDVKLLNSVIYIWQGDLQVKTFSVESLEELVIKTLLNKQYYLCAELCLNYKEDIKDLIKHSERIHLISILKNKLDGKCATNLLEQIHPVLCMLEQYNKQKVALKKQTNGIVLVANTYKDADSEEYDMYIPESVQNFKVLNGADSSQMEECIVETVSANGNSFKNEELKQKQFIGENKELLSLYKQYQLNKSHRNAELTESSNLLDKLNLDDILNLFGDFILFVQKLDKTDAELWCKEQFLKQASRKVFSIKDIQESTLKYLTEAFLELNKTSNCNCKCNFPLPKCRKKPLEYYELGSKIISQLENTDSYVAHIPYLYKCKLLTIIVSLNDLMLNLPLMIQFSDKELFEKFLGWFTYDTWDETVKLFIKLKQGLCLNCGALINLEGVLSWTELGLLIIMSIGAKNTSRLLTRYSNHIPEGELSLRFYQSCILSTTLGNPNLAVNFMKKVVNENTSHKYEELLERFLRQKYLGHQPLTTVCDVYKDVPKCAYCELPLNERSIGEYLKAHFKDISILKKVEKELTISKRFCLGRYSKIDKMYEADLLPLLQSSLCYYVGVYKNVACYPIPTSPSFYYPYIPLYMI
ncbi:hypothetical protein NQ317_006839 [Molorchus minor]|uniref:Hermansky-Pudlak syndrome 5 protein homolog n=1 Tax=Molorchus minor TaxID=1323400 RepID=A0ABQ9K2C8_9CUCU|nr:hypothetical protein NQ317_006839 [Molorchus minor]